MTETLSTPTATDDIETAQTVSAVSGGGWLMSVILGSNLAALVIILGLCAATVWG